MALFRKKKRDGDGDVQRATPTAGPSRPGGSEPAQAEHAPLGAGLERKWEEAWHRARARLHT